MRTDGRSVESACGSVKPGQCEKPAQKPECPHLPALGPTLGGFGLALAFVIGGLREIGEPARKAMVADLVPPDVRTQAIGLYWSVRSLAVMWASPVGAILWVLGDNWRAGFGPILTFSVAGIAGLIGVIAFYTRFGTGTSLHQSEPGEQATGQSEPRR